MSIALVCHMVGDEFNPRPSKNNDLGNLHLLCSWCLSVTQLSSQCSSLTLFSSQYSSLTLLCSWWSYTVTAQFPVFNPHPVQFLMFLYCYCSVLGVHPSPCSFPGVFIPHHAQFLVFIYCYSSVLGVHILLLFSSQCLSLTLLCSRCSSLTQLSSWCSYTVTVQFSLFIYCSCSVLGVHPSPCSVLYVHILLLFSSRCSSLTLFSS